MTLIYKLSSVAALCCGLSLLVRVICNYCATRKKAQAAGILHRHYIPLAKPWILVLDVLLTVFLCYNVYVGFHNYKTYNHIADYVTRHGIEDVLEIKGISEDAISDKEKFTENYIHTEQRKAERALWGGVSEIGMLFLILSVNLWLCGGYVTPEGWYWMFSARKPEVIHIREEGGKLCFYLGEANSAIMKLPDTVDHRDTCALIMEETTEVGETD